MSDRRGFFLGAIYGLWGLITAAIVLPASAYLMLPLQERARTATGWKWATSSQLRVREPEEVVFRRKRVDGWKVVSEKTSTWLVRLSDKEVVAYTPQCTHLGCAYPLGSGDQRLRLPVPHIGVLD